MKQSLFLGIAGVAVLLAGCNDGKLPGGWLAGTGGITPTVSVDPSLATGARAMRSAKEIDAADLSLRLIAADGSLDRTWAKVADFDAEEDFAVGDYIFEAFYGAADAEGFEAPYYYGSSAISVRENVTTTVAVTASLANAMVSINYTDAFKDYMAEWSATASSDAGKATIEFAADEQRPAYITPGAVTIKTNVTKPNGNSATLQAATFNAVPRHHYIVTIDVNNGEAGNAVLTVTYDDSVEETQTIEIDLSDKIFSAAGPELKLTGFNSGETIDHVEGSPAPAPLKLDIIARGGLASVRMTTESATLRLQGWPEEIDLIAADASTQTTLKALGMKALGLWQNPDKMAVIDLTDVLSHLAVTPAGATETKITFTVTDRYSKTSEPVELAVNLKKLLLEISGHGSMPYGSESINLDIAYNGANAEADLTFQKKNERGSWDKLTLNSITATGENTYTASVAIPAADADATFRVVSASGLASTPVEVPLIEPNVQLAATDNNTFATFAYVEADGEAAEGMQFEYSADGGASFKKAQASRHTAQARSGAMTFKVAGLPSGADLLLRVNDADHASRPVAIHTETATQLENGSLDEDTWTITASESNWERWAVAGWGTYNAMTTMTSGTRHNTAYVSRSGTARTNDAHSGFAAELRTIGWGAGNSAVGSIKDSNPKYINKGMLYLGGSPTAHDQLEQQHTKGIAFESRPTAISFWYKYSKKNSADYGGALIWVKDADGNEIASGSISNLNADSYTPVSIPLTYGFNSAKAATIYVEFVSSDHPDWATRSKDWFTVPSFGNLSDGKFQGSSLFIDDIELVY